MITMAEIDALRAVADEATERLRVIRREIERCSACNGAGTTLRYDEDIAVAQRAKEYAERDVIIALRQWWAQQEDEEGTDASRSTP